MADLMAAGLHPTEQEMSSPALDASDGADGRASVVEAVIRAEARVTALEEVVARQDEELRFLRQLALDTVARRAGG